MNSADKTIELLTAILNSKKRLAETLVEKGEEASEKEPFDDLVQKAADYIPKSYIFVDEEGNEIAGALVSQETVFDATPNDVREGKVFASDLGVKTGEKIIPAYHTTEGYRIIPNGSEFALTGLSDLNKYEYTKLQAILCPYNSSISQSVAAEKVAINEGVYAVNSTELLATVVKDNSTKSIRLGITNDSGSPCVLRYFTYKEIY